MMRERETGYVLTAGGHVIDLFSLFSTNDAAVSLATNSNVVKIQLRVYFLKIEQFELIISYLPNCLICFIRESAPFKSNTNENTFKIKPVK